MALLACTPADNESRNERPFEGDTLAPASSPEFAQPVIVAPARIGDLVLTVTTRGIIRSERESELKSEVTATVQRVRVFAGQRVKRGDPLVEFDPRPFDLAIRQREAELERATLSYNDALMPDSIATGRGPSEGRRRAAAVRAGLPSAMLNLEQARLDRERATVVAPFDGAVSRVEVAAGERVTPGQLITRVDDVDHLRVEADVLEHDIATITPGGLATVSTSAAPEVKRRSRVAAVLAAIDTANHAGTVFVALPASPLYRPGMSVDVEVEAERIANCLLVPSAAVIERDGRPLVFVVRQGRAEWVYVRRGRDNGSEVQLLPDSLTKALPLRAGELVVTMGHLTLAHQAPVRVVDRIGGT